MEKFFIFLLLVFPCFQYTLGRCRFCADNSIDNKNGIAAWINAVQVQNFRQANHYLQTCKDYYPIQQLVYRTYQGNLTRLPNLLLFLNQTQDQHDQLNGFRALRDDMRHFKHEETREMMHLMYFAKLAMSNKNLTAGVARQYEDLKASFPRNMKAILFDSRVRICSYSFKEYLYKAPFKEDNKFVFMLWRDGYLSTQEEFYFKAFWFLDVLMFTMHNDYDEPGYGMTSGKKYINDDRHMAVSSTGSSMLSIDPEGDTFTIRFMAIGNYLYASDYVKDDKRRYPFIWSGSNPPAPGESKRRWFISPLDLRLCVK